MVFISGRALKPSVLAAGVAALLVGCGGGREPEQGGTVAEPAAACEKLAGTTVGGAEIGSSTLVAGTDDHGEFCRVTGVIHSNLAFRIDLPSQWNGMLLAQGGGGWDGDIQDYAWSPSGANGNYLVVRTNGGRNGSAFDASPFLDDAQARLDFGHLSMHTAYTVAMELSASHYGTPPARKYFEGCSNGGREALVQASRYPSDYDGIVVRAPAYNFTSMMRHFLANSQAMAVPGGYLSDAHGAAISNAALSRCDALDGAVDGVVANPAACDFTVETMRCTGTTSDTCLTDAQMTTARTLYSPLRAADGTEIYPGWGYGGEATDWAVWLTGSAIGGLGSQTIFADGLVKYWLARDPAAQLLGFDPEAHGAALALASTIIDVGPDLASYFSGGGKLILAHGTTDWAISYKASVKYYEDVGATVGKEQRDAAMEFFLQPGVGHCAGGAGPDSVELLDAVRAWVESGTRPSSQRLIAAKKDEAGQRTATRPLCRYPTYPKYLGAGSITSAESYACTE
ncbi:tannase/feruloyl esterase family alpha/beta hydrolase [Pseudorhodoferax soli]|uniref:Feruloyl esterase n=1 Tax=Pseudorhodoferax soli TaxID=545864 RepID=A0A368XNR8_9BURK|nr:tannase/feruloyl esterase family alpha/beta hydrolase [Pseudorhodoferax soli]RCW68658.1 feruloyl esterase [Pseudorhodoferax soli]